MSKSSSENPIVKWIDYRMPIFTLLRRETTDYQAPKNLNYWWNTGSLAGIIMIILIITGIMLAMFYIPHTSMAFESIEHIMRDVNYGWLLRYLHSNGASMMFIIVYIHMFRGIYYGSYKEPRELLWIIGVLILGLMVPICFMGYVLVWGQMSFWACTVITSMFSAIPWFGEAALEWIWGGYSVGDPTLVRFYSLHYVLPFVILALVLFHVWALHVHKSNNPLGIDPKGPEDTIPFDPYYTVKDYFGIGVFMIIFMFFVFFAPNFFSEPINYQVANPLSTPPLIVPEWYLLPYYTILKAIPYKAGGVFAMLAAIVILAFLPWFDRSKVKSGHYRPLFKWFFWLFVIDCAVLTWMGARPPEGLYLLTGRIATIYYFAYFLVILPLVAKFERPLPLPESISNPVPATSSKEKE